MLPFFGPVEQDHNLHSMHYPSHGFDSANRLTLKELRYILLRNHQDLISRINRAVTRSKLNISLPFTENESIYVKSGNTIDRDVRLMYLNEALFLSRISHPHIVKLRDCGLDEIGRPYLAIEKLNFQPDALTISEDTTTRIGDKLVSILNVIDLLGFLNLSQGDIKPEHILVDSKGNFVLIDFAQIFSLSDSALIGTTGYLAPELFWHYGYSIQSDLFALGLTFLNLHYQSGTSTDLLTKYGSSLRPWSPEDLVILKSTLDKSNPIASCITKMISYSPLTRQTSGRDILKYLISQRATTWTFEKYDALISNSLSSYIAKTHWISYNNPLFKRKPIETIRIKQCHKECISSFNHNFKILSKFYATGDYSTQRPEIGTTGVSVCRSKYQRNLVPRLFQKSASIPSSFDIRGSFLNDQSSEHLLLNYDFHLCYNTRTEKKAYVSSKESNSADLVERVRNCALRNDHQEGLKLITNMNFSKTLDSSNSLILRSYHAYFQASLGNTNEAQEILERISESALHSASATALSEYCSLSGWCALLRGDLICAFKQLSTGLSTFDKAEDNTDTLKSITFNRLATVKWMTEGASAAIQCNDVALQYANKTQNRDLLASIYLNRCMFLGDSGYLSAETKCQDTLRLLITNVDSAYRILNYLHNFSTFCLRSGNSEMAVITLQRAFGIILAMPDSKRESSYLLTLLGNTYLNSRNMGKAYQVLRQAARWHRQTENHYGYGKCIQNIAEIYALTGSQSLALKYLKLASSHYKKTKNELGLCDIVLLKLWYSELKELKFAKLSLLLRRSIETGNTLTEFLTLWLIFLCNFVREDWKNCLQTVNKMRKATEKSDSDSTAKDIELLVKILNSAKKSNSQGELNYLKAEIIIQIRKRSPISFRDVNSDVVQYILDNPIVLQDKKILKQVLSEIRIEGSVMFPEKPKKDNVDASGKADNSITKRFQVIKQIAGLVDHSKNLDEYVSQVLDLTVETLGASRGVIFIVSKYSESPEVLGSSGCKDNDLTDIKNISKSLLQHALGGNSIFIRNSMTVKDYDKIQSLIAKNIKSAICIPLKKNSEVFGAIYIDSVRFTTLFEDLDKAFLDAFGAIISGGISSSYRLQKLDEDYQRVLQLGQDTGLKSYEGVFLPSKEMQKIYKTIFKLSRISLPVLLLGQTGSGKDVLARMIHENSETNSGRFVAINCSAIPLEHLESELFGVADKAFTNVSERKGKFELADNGTLFLDEIAEMPLQLQAKLLRVIETKEVEPVGGSGKSRKIKFRLISATNNDIQELVSEGKFREDLYHRINDVVIKIPDLSGRPEDIEVLTQHYYSFFQNKLNMKCGPLKEGILTAFLKYDWPGGIRELSKVVSKLVVSSDGSSFVLEGIPAELKGAITININNGELVNPSGNFMKKEDLLSALRKHNYSIRATARLLSIPESTLRYNMKKLNIKATPKRLQI